MRPQQDPGTNPAPARPYRWRALLKRWRRNRRGSVLPIVAMCGLVLTGVTGLALDGARMAIMYSRLQSSVDAAGLSAAARVSTEDFEDEVEKFTEANFVDGYIGAEITSLTAVPSANADTFTVSATAEASTIFMRVFGLDTFSTSAETEVTRAMGGLELALVLDVTGSMAGSRINSLKTASRELLAILFGTKETVEHLHVGIVPFSQAVNVGTSRTSWLTSQPGKNSGWAGCVEERFNGRDVTDAGISEEKFRPAVGMTYCPTPMTPLTSTKSTLQTAINNLKAEGGTFVNAGAVWGWRMLSPKWRGSWGGSMGSTLPLNYGTDGMSKAVVIMTDGENQYNTGGSYGGVTCTKSGSRYSCKTDARLNTTDTSENNLNGDKDIVLGPNAPAALDRKFSEICTSMKNAGITVYTVAFGSPGATIEARLRTCATQPAFYFDSPNGATLKTAFARIGDSLSNLRVSR